MRGNAFIAFFGLATALSGALIGCGDDEEEQQPAAPKVAKSGVGESCVRTDDCESGLACFGNVCQEQANETGGTSGTGGTTSILGEDGETCSRRADCQPGLKCLNGRCGESGTGEGGGANVPTQGSRGETCVVSSDCESPLVCLPSSAAGSVGVCSDGDSTVAATGNVCGAECKDATDCCQLPVELHAGLGAKSCADLADLIGTGDCSAATGATVLSQLCFAQATYCDCDPGTWACNDGMCSYEMDCTTDDLFQGGCATFSRAGHGLPSTCDTADTGKCVSATCATDTDCEGLPVVDDPSDTCTDGECTCYQSNCYRKCDAALDCRVGFDCDDGSRGTHLCMPVDACTEDVTCKRQRGDVRAQCVNNVCTMPCETDLDCNPTGLINGRFTQVCNDDGMCEPIGCTRDADCVTGTGVQVFCGTPVPLAATFQSAITD